MPDNHTSALLHKDDQPRGSKSSDEKLTMIEEELPDAPINRVKTANSIIMTPELFEKLCMTPHTTAKGSLQSTLGNPSPLALVGLLVGLTPLACDLMGWRGAGHNGAASIGGFYFIGGLLLILSGLLDFVLGNTFPFVVFTSYGGFFLAYAATLQPVFNAAGAYSSTGTNTADAEISPAFQASFGFFLLAMNVLNLLFVVCSIRTNICFLIIFSGAVIGFGFLTGSAWNLALSNPERALILQKGGGGCFFMSSIMGLYLLVLQLFEAVDFPLQLPIGDLSHIFKGANNRCPEA